jgi:hypothetical protein
MLGYIILILLLAVFVAAFIVVRNQRDKIYDSMVEYRRMYWAECDRADDLEIRLIDGPKPPKD